MCLQVGEARAKLIARLALKPPASAADTPASPNMLGTTGSRSSSGGGSSSNSSGDGVLGSGGGAGTSPVLDGLVSRQPLLLVKNVDSLLDELERWGGGVMLNLHAYVCAHAVVWWHPCCSASGMQAGSLQLLCNYC